MFMPPSTAMDWPVMKSLSSEARKITVPARSARSDGPSVRSSGAKPVGLTDLNRACEKTL